jgi:hypothetical protein
LTPPSSHLCTPQCASKQKRNEELGSEALRLQQHIQEAQQELADAKSCHEVQVAQLDDKHSSLLEAYIMLQREHNDVLKQVADTKVRVQCHCKRLAASCCCCYSGCTAQLLQCEWLL